jgi:hypothetical protein
VSDPSEGRSPIGLALEWASRIFAVALLMFLPGVLGHWLDGRLGTRFLALVGFVVGLVSGIWVLLAMTKTVDPVKRRTGPREEKGQQE